jgi:hypothetical protein
LTLPAVSDSTDADSGFNDDATNLFVFQYCNKFRQVEVIRSGPVSDPVDWDGPLLWRLFHNHSHVVESMAMSYLRNVSSDEHAWQLSGLSETASGLPSCHFGSAIEVVHPAAVAIVIPEEMTGALSRRTAVRIRNDVNMFICSQNSHQSTRQFESLSSTLYRRWLVTDLVWTLVINTGVRTD